MAGHESLSLGAVLRAARTSDPRRARGGGSVDEQMTAAGYDAHLGAATSVAVVGGRGFIGRKVVHALRRRGHDVLVFDRDAPVLEGGELARAARTVSHVVWSASTINPMIAENDPDRVAQDLVTFEEYLRAAAAAPRTPTTVLLSSGGTVYDLDAVPPFRESAPVRPASAYGEAKLAIEEGLRRSGQAGVVLRVSNAYGPGQPVAPGQGVVSHWLHAAASGQTLHLFGDQGVARDYVYVDDLAAAVVHVVEHDGRLPAVLNVGSGRATSLRALLQVVEAVVGDDLPPVEIHPARGFDARSTWLDCGLAEERLGWTAQTRLEDGVRETWHAIVGLRPSRTGT